MSKNKGYSKRAGSQRVMTKRSPSNKHKHDTIVNHATLKQGKAKYHSLKLLYAKQAPKKNYEINLYQHRYKEDWWWCAPQVLSFNVGW